MRCIRLHLEYEGTRYHGWQVQPGVRSVQGTLEQVFSRISGRHVRIIAAGRTDAGVHARGQVAHFFTDSRLEVRELLMAMNSLLPEDIAVTSVEEAPPTFHARKSALEKRYEYWIWNDRLPSVFSRRFAWHVKPPLDPDAMRAAARFIQGTRDFTSFQASGSPEGCNPVRTIHRVEIQAPCTGSLCIIVEGVSFLRHMVRILVGTLADVGQGKVGVAEMEAILQARDRRAAGRTAPAKGLFLIWVRYPEGASGDGERVFLPDGIDKNTITG
jgi:tRNA pseudouridine38-40 synthase